MIPKKLVRIVDDDEDVRESLATVLRMEGYDVATWADPRAYLREDAPNVPGCLLLDVMMPGISGYELHRRILERALFIPVIFISAYGDIESVVKSMRLGAVDFLPKPLSPERVLAAVDMALKSQSVPPLKGMTKNEALKRFESLTPREKSIFALLWQGKSNTQIGLSLNISPKTVENHRTAAYRKMMIHSAEEAKAVMRTVEEMRSELGLPSITTEVDSAD